MKWWDDLWLNESFANMMEYVSVNAIEPSWNIFEDFPNNRCSIAKRDATDGVQSVHVEVKHPDEINTLFDPAIVYAKGSRLMHMLRRWLGDDAFRKGLKAYWKNINTAIPSVVTAWMPLGDASGRDVAAFMDSWLEQPGYQFLQQWWKMIPEDQPKTILHWRNMKIKAANGLCHWTATGLAFQTHLKQAWNSRLCCPYIEKNNEPLYQYGK